MTSVPHAIRPLETSPAAGAFALSGAPGASDSVSGDDTAASPFAALIEDAGKAGTNGHIVLPEGLENTADTEVPGKPDIEDASDAPVPAAIDPALVEGDAPPSEAEAADVTDPLVQGEGDAAEARQPDGKETQAAADTSAGKVTAVATRSETEETGDNHDLSGGTDTEDRLPDAKSGEATDAVPVAAGPAANALAHAGVVENAAAASPTASAAAAAPRPPAPTGRQPATTVPGASAGADAGEAPDQFTAANRPAAADTASPSVPTPKGDQTAAAGGAAQAAQFNRLLNTELGERSGPPPGLSQGSPETAVFASPPETDGPVVRASSPLSANAPPVLPMRAVAVHMARNFADGNRQFEIRLDPPSLGRIEVRMDITRDGQVTAQLTADRPETLDALQRDQRVLERALQTAGLDVDSGSLKFSLRQDGDDGSHKTADQSNTGTAGEPDADTAEPETERRIVTLTAVDLRV